MSSRITSGLVAVAAVFAMVLPGTAAAQPAGAEIEVTGAFDKPAFDSGEAITATITIKNTGSAAAEKVRVGTSGGTSGFRPETSSWGPVAQTSTGIRLAPGASQVVHLTGKVSQVVDGQLVLQVQIVTSSAEGDKSNNSVNAKAAVTFGAGTAAFTVYGDANGNNKVDAGEGIAGVAVHLIGPATASREQELTTGPDGKAVFPGLATGSYRATYVGAAGYQVTPDLAVVVQTGKQVDVIRKADKGLSDRLDAKLAFDKDAYAAGDALTLKVTLTSKGTAFPAVHAYCTGAGEPYELVNTDDSWGDLKYEGNGVALAAGQTKTVEVKTAIPQGSSAFGFVSATCQFGPEVDGGEGYPQSVDTAKVPGDPADASGRLSQDGDQPVPATKIVLVDTGTTHPVASATTDADGKFEFKGVPAGRYDPVVVGPWQLVAGKDNLFSLVKDVPHVHDLAVVAGPEVADPETATPSTSETPTSEPTSEAPVAADGADNDSGFLASTGASVLGLSLLGLLVLVGGAAIVVTVRRRKGKGDVGPEQV
ncbi:SdrD B-like domain-containing protein [Umezawaea tangerina]|uniref:LPXTG-motif cell wall-anchored protein/uncharacterized repeat protein (TIGR01451 family) n=1 Tax=Umezawaea tangerina TaxID=84725 RepID=A0A2T0TKM5_9PSEU|nr:SdrD B-like domain-containing protein [Umezawaea tangerina]PRY46078.1 LPXTG-motif cell wall-anchored protein/uncharacterized repeat protein (TIGR01451 family) [Umezawaea tangerina]